MDHPFEHRAHYNAEGKPCHCPWGYDEGGEHLGSVKESSKLDWLKGRPDMQSPEGQKFLDFVGDSNPYAPSYLEADKMLPWLAREWKKGRLNLPTDPHDRRMSYEDQSGLLNHINAGQMKETQAALEEMSKRRQGVDVMQHKVHELVPKVQEFQDWKKVQNREGLGEELHRFPDGWSVRRLNTPEEFEDEGNEMGHCLNEERDRYHDQSENGQRIFVSLRDHKNLPHATMELTPDHWRRGEETANHGGYYDFPGTRSEGWEPQLGPDATIQQFYGKEDAPPLIEYERRMGEWLHPHGVPFEWEENPEADLWREEQGLAPAIAAGTQPLYYRWVYSPSKGVTLNSNQDDHPALVKYHTGLSGDINDIDLSHGYASHIGGGWRITDLEHQPVEDPYIVQQVVRRLNHEEGPEIRSEGSWQPSEFNWDRLHYGIPCEKLGTS